jgi:two-component system, NarL family, sensor histidine kinase DesK
MSRPGTTVNAMTHTGDWTLRTGRTGRFGVAFAAVWLVFLGDTFQAAWRTAWSGRHAVAGWVALVALVAFVVCYLAAFVWIRSRRQQMLFPLRRGQALLVLAVLLGLTVVTAVAIGQPGMAGTVYVAVVAVMTLPTRQAIASVLALAVASEVTARMVPGWTEQAGLTFAICSAGFAMWGVQQLMLRNADLLQAREENARLAVADERNRFARDLHDILGHSLTVITVKAELANRLLDVDVDRARSELTDLERLSRDALVDVRRAVEGYREITLPGELARAREALAAAAIASELPNSTDDVPTHLRDLFAWTVREGVTNVIRHSRAAHCTVRLSADTVAVCDDGPGPATTTPPGHGLSGLRERATAVGAVVVTSALDPQGFALKVTAR